MLCALIMAGGKGRRLQSRYEGEKPKQFLKLIEERTMIQITFDRIKKVVPIDRIFVATTEEYVHIVKRQLPQIKEENIIEEPMGKNTAPCIILSSIYIKEALGDVDITVLPSDHYIDDEEEFLRILLQGKGLIHRKGNGIMTLGIKPTRGECGYGYIKYGKRLGVEEIFKVEKFLEKPNEEKAKEYFESGEYLWNSGMFIFRAGYMLELADSLMKKCYDDIQSCFPYNKEELRKTYANLDYTSVDKGIMEKCEDIYVIPSDIGWSDVGSLKELEKVKKEKQKNRICRF